VIDRDVPAVSVVIPTYNRPSALKDALCGMIANQAGDFEVLVMDQSTSDDTKLIVESFADPRFVYHKMTRRGACPARNLGGALARADIVAFTDDDCVPESDWISKIKQAFAEDAELQFIFGKLEAPPSDGRNGGYPSFEPEKMLAQGKSGWRIAMVAAGANMSCRKSFLRQLGGFDELLGPNVPGVKSNDASISYKVWRSGMKWVARGDISVLHLHGFRESTSLWDLLTGYSYGSGVNYARFVRRGDARALGLFLLEQMDLVRPPLSRLFRLRRPTDIQYYVRHFFALLQGFFRGLLVPPALGYVDGAEFRRLETERVP
jgi:glycosyltransferase involved in cell wall biosynthesis